MTAGEHGKEFLSDTEPPEITQEVFEIAKARAKRVQEVLGLIPEDWDTYAATLKKLEETEGLPGYPNDSQPTQE